MKHTWTFLLALLLALSLTACGGGEKQTNDQNNSVTSGTGGSDHDGGQDRDGDHQNNGGLTGNDASGDGLNGSNGSSNGSSDSSSGLNGSNNSSANHNGGVMPGDIDGDGDSLLDPGADANGSGPSTGTAGSAANSSMGGNPVPQSHGGWRPASFDQMLRNARVHDRDGILTDFENSVTPGSTHF